MWKAPAAERQHVGRVCAAGCYGTAELAANSAHAHAGTEPRQRWRWKLRRDSQAFPQPCLPAPSAALPRPPPRPARPKGRQPQADQLPEGGAPALGGSEQRHAPQPLRSVGDQGCGFLSLHQPRSPPALRPAARPCTQRKPTSPASPTSSHVDLPSPSRATPHIPAIFPEGFPELTPPTPKHPTKQPTPPSQNDSRPHPRIPQHLGLISSPLTPASTGLGPTHPGQSHRRHPRRERSVTLGSKKGGGARRGIPVPPTSPAPWGKAAGPATRAPRSLRPTADRAGTRPPFPPTTA